jgi:hypothetical protein
VSESCESFAVLVKMRAAGRTSEAAPSVCMNCDRSQSGSNVANRSTYKWSMQKPDLHACLTKTCGSNATRDGRQAKAAAPVPSGYVACQHATSFATFASITGKKLHPEPSERMLDSPRRRHQAL